MQTPIDFGKDFLNRFYDRRDADGCLQMLAGDLVWITPEEMHHFLSEGAVLKFLRRQISADAQARYVDIASMKSSPSAENIMTVAYEVNLVSGEDERPLHLRCSMAICRRGRRLEITFLHFSKRAERDSSEQLRDFVTNLPCGVMILACLDGQREEALFYNEYFAHRLRYRQEEFARAMAKNPFFMTSEEDRDRIQEEIDRARKSGGSISANLRFYRRDGNSFYYRMTGAPAYQANGGTVYYCVFQETTGYRLTADRLQGRLDSTMEILRQIPEGICGIEYPAKAGSGTGDRRRDPRVFFVSKNVPALFGVSNSAYMKNILQDPSFGLEMTSITRSRILKSGIFDPGQSGSAGPVSLGIYRLKKAGGRTPETGFVKAGERSRSAAGQGNSEGSGFPSDAGVPAETGFSPDGEVPAETGFSPDGEVPAETGSLSGVEVPAETQNETDRIELVVRRVCGKDRTVRLYLFYYNREDQQREQEERVDRAMKMGRAGQDQLRAELQRAKESAARQKSEHNAALRAAQEKHDAEMTRAEDQRLEEKNRAVLLSRRLEESRAAQKRMEAELEEVKNDAVRRIRSCEARADRKVKLAEEGLRAREMRADEKVKEALEEVRRRETEAEEKAELSQEAVRKAEAARSLAQEQLREAQERARILEQQLQRERARRLLLEEQWDSGRTLPIAHGTGQTDLLQADPFSSDRLSAEQFSLRKDDPAGRSGGQDAVQVPAPHVPQTPKREPAAADGREVRKPVYQSVNAAAFSQENVQAAHRESVLSVPQEKVPAASRESVPAANRESVPAAAHGEKVPAVSRESVPAASRVSLSAGQRESLPAASRENISAGHRESVPVAAHGEKVLPGDWMAETDTLTVFSAMDPADPAGAGKSDPAKRPPFTAGQEQSSPASLGQGQRPPFSGEQGQSPSASAEQGQRLLSSTVQGQSPVSFQEIREEEAGGQEQDVLVERAFSPEECLRTVLSYGERVCAEKEIRLRSYRDSRLPLAVTGFGDLLLRALCELLRNAIDHTQPGGTVSVHSRADRPSGGFVNLYFRVDCDGSLPQDPLQTALGGGEPARDVFGLERKDVFRPERQDAIGSEGQDAFGPGNGFESANHFGPDAAYRQKGVFGLEDMYSPEDGKDQDAARISAAREAAALMGGSIDTSSDSEGIHRSMAITLRVQT